MTASHKRHLIYIDTERFAALLDEMMRSGWTLREIARQAVVSRGTISHMKTKPGSGIEKKTYRKLREFFREQDIHPESRFDPLVKEGRHLTTDIIREASVPYIASSLHPTQPSALVFRDNEWLSPPSPVQSLEIRPDDVSLRAHLEFSALSQEAEPGIHLVSPDWVPDPSGPGLAPDEVAATFRAKNAQRQRDEAQGVRPESTHVPLVRLIATPTLRGTHLSSIVAPFSWDLFSVQFPYPASPHLQSAGSYIPTERTLRAVEAYRSSFPRLHPSDIEDPHPKVTPRNFIPLGLDLLLITKDGWALVRQKSSTTTASPNLWNCSFSGYARFDLEYCAESPTENPGVCPLNLSRWIQTECWRETNYWPANLERCFIFGIHRNTHTGSNDILGMLHADVTMEELGLKLTIGKRLDEESDSRIDNGLPRWSEEEREQRRRELLAELRDTHVLEHSRGAYEAEVKGTNNKFVGYTPEAFALFFQELAEDYPDAGVYPPLNAIPEALLNMALALRKQADPEWNRHFSVQSEDGDIVALFS